jgi:hypothetical protein
MEKEKQAISAFLRGCSTNSHCNSDDKSINDFLLVSIFLLENLTCKGNYEEAIRITDAISACSLCKDTLSTTCNCKK